MPQQTALQTTHYPLPNNMNTYPAPEPRDIVWANMTPTPTALLTRDIIVMGCIVVLFFTYLIPITALASLLSYEEIHKKLPWLGELIDSSPQIKVLVQNSLPSVAIVSLNALLPSLLEALCYVQGFRARSWVEYSLLKKSVPSTTPVSLLLTHYSKIFQLPSSQRRLHISSRNNILAALPRPRRFSCQDSREVGKGSRDWPSQILLPLLRDSTRLRCHASSTAQSGCHHPEAADAYVGHPFSQRLVCHPSCLHFNSPRD